MRVTSIVGCEAHIKAWHIARLAGLFPLRCGDIGQHRLDEQICLYVIGTFCSSTNTSEREVYFAGNAKEIKNAASGASSAGIRITFRRRRNIAK